MSEVGYAAAVLLAGVFVAAALAKARHRQATVAGFAGLGLPAPRLLAVAVPSAELALAGALLAVPRLGGGAALVMLGAFTVVLAGAVRRGSEVGCSCFGGSAARPPSSVELLRNGMLSVLAAGALMAGSPMRPGLPAIIVVTMAALIAACALAAADLRRQVGAFWANTLAGELHR